MGYCVLCGNTGIKLDGTPCSCRLQKVDMYAGVECFDIPEAYRGIKFDSSLLPNLYGKVYKDMMKKNYDTIVTLRWRCKNLIICSAPQSGKSIFAYSAIQELFRLGIDVFPMMDMLELRRIMMDIEYGKSESMGITNISRLLSVPYLFAVMPQITTYDTYDTAVTLISRRVRRGGSTILLYEGVWNQLVYNDSRGVFKSLKGDGSFTTIMVSSWEVSE